MKKQVLILLAILTQAIAPTFAYDFSSRDTGNTLYYTITGPNTVAVTHPNSSAPFWTMQPSGSLIIPYNVWHENQRYEVTSIDNNAFSGCIYITSLSIPNSITSIGWYAFSGCSGLTSVTIPQSVTNIAEGAFSNCSNLEQITLPDTLDAIEYQLFKNCSALQRINIPQTVTEIENSAFESCSVLDSVIIPNSVTSISNLAFWGCSGLHYLEIGSNVNSIGYSCFDRCTGLSSLHVKRVYPPTIQENTFANCSPYTPLYIPCGSISFYQTAPYWSQFTTMHEEGCLHTIEVLTPDNDQGLVEGGGTYRTGDTATLRAAGMPGFRFDQWSDSINDNPRYVIVTSDRTFTALFTEDNPIVSNDTIFTTEYDTIFTPEYDTIYITIHDTILQSPIFYDLNVFSGNPQRGLVAGNGRFPDSTWIEIAAIPLEGNQFVQWQDGNTENPRAVQLIGSDANYIATFDAGTQAIGDVSKINDFQINVHKGQIVVSNAENQRIRIFDNLGRLLTTTYSHDRAYIIKMPNTGVYFVQVGDANAQKVVVVQ